MSGPLQLRDLLIVQVLKILDLLTILVEALRTTVAQRVAVQLQRRASIIEAQFQRTGALVLPTTIEVQFRRLLGEVR